MHKSASTDQQNDPVRGDHESPVKYELTRQTRDILQVLNRKINWLAGFFRLTEEEQKAAGVYLGHHRHD